MRLFELTWINRIVEIARLCKEHAVGHIINNAYGVQTSKPMHLIIEVPFLSLSEALLRKNRLTL